MIKRTVQFIGLGASHSGSDFIYTYIAEHPEVCVIKKNTRFFAKKELFSKGIGWYEAHFAGCKSGKIRGECSTSYLFSKLAPKRISQTYPDAKLFAVVSNPIDRLCREFRMLKKRGLIDKSYTLLEYLERHPEMLQAGLYAKSLQNYFEYYSPINMYIAVHEDRYENPIEYVQKIYDFIGVRKNFVPKALRGFVVEDEEVQKKSFLQILFSIILFPFKLFGIVAIIKKTLRLTGLDKKITKLLSKKSEDTAIYKPLPERASRLVKECVSPELYALLSDYYYQDVKELSVLLHRNLNEEWHIYKQPEKNKKRK